MSIGATSRILLVTGLSGAGKSTVLKTLEDLGWEAIDNFPVRLAKPLLDLPQAEGSGDADMPLAIGFDSRTRGFEPTRLINEIRQLQKRDDVEIMTLFVDCAGAEIERRYSETRRRHPLAQDRPAIDGIAQERALMEPLRDWSDLVIDTSHMSASDLQAEIRDRFRQPDGKMTVSLVSFGFSRGVPPNADLIFDLRFLQNPHWDPELRPMTGLDRAVGEYVSADEGYQEAFGHGFSPTGPFVTVRSITTIIPINAVAAPVISGDSLKGPNSVGRATCTAPRITNRAPKS